MTTIQALAGLAPGQLDPRVPPPPPPAMRQRERVPTRYHSHADDPQFLKPYPTSELANRQPANETPDPKLQPFLETLLHHYRDVLEGIPDREHSTSDDLLALMCPAWNHESYQELERLLRAMPPRLRQALRVRYERYSERRVAWCRKCGATESPKRVGKVHSHCRIKGRVVSLQPKMLRVLPADDDPKKVALALGWLVSNWRGAALLPKAIEEIESERKLAA